MSEAVYNIITSQIINKVLNYVCVNQVCNYYEIPRPFPVMCFEQNSDQTQLLQPKCTTCWKQMRAATSDDKEYAAAYFHLYANKWFERFYDDCMKRHWGILEKVGFDGKNGRPFWWCLICDKAVEGYNHEF